MAALHRVRRNNLKTLIEMWAGATRLAKRLGHAGPSYLSQLMSGNRPVTETTARGIEEALGLRVGWLDEDR